jgi:hypothetical protein
VKGHALYPWEPLRRARWNAKRRRQYTPDDLDFDPVKLTG